MMRAAFWALVAATLGLYGTMVVWSLRRIAEAAGGLAPFDIRPGGYSYEEARAFLAVLDPETIAFYLNVQQRLDLAYPVMLATVLGIALAVLWRHIGRWRWWLVGIVLVGSACDYAENHLVAGLLRAGSEGVTPLDVARASLATSLKSGLTTVAMIAVVVGLARKGWIRWRGRA